MSCSFCQSRSHNISQCYHPMIDVFYERIKVIYVDMMNQYPHDTELRFKSVLTRRFNLRELRGVSVKYLQAVARSTKVVLIDILWQYFSSRIYLPERQENDGWIEARRLPVVPDPVPTFARDLEEAPPEDEQSVMWYIDTTPSPISSLDFPQSINPRNSAPVSEARNLQPEFEAVAQAPQVKKYNIRPLLVYLEDEEGIEECAICYESVSSIDLVKLNCSHAFCGGCIKGTLKAYNNIYCGPACALCRAPMTSFSVKNPKIYNLVSEHCNFNL